MTMPISIRVRRSRVLAVGAAALALLTTRGVPLAAQATITLDVSGYSAMVWRGVTTTNRPVINPTLSLAVPTRAGEFTVGVWSNAEPVHYRPATMLDSYGGAPGPLFSMHEVWAEGTRDIGRVATTLGASTYLYPKAGDLSAYNTVELHASAALPTRFTPTLAAHYDVGPVGGGFVELSASHDASIVRGRTISLAAAAGWSLGQGAGADPDAIAYFARDGFTHVETSMSTAMQVGRVAVAPSLHLVWATDPWTRTVAPDRDRRLKVWVGTSLSWSRLVGRAAARNVATAGATTNATK